MKKHIRLLIVLVCAYCAVSCTPTQFAGMQKRRIVSDYEQERIIVTHFPDLVEYLYEGVLNVQKLNEYTSSDGDRHYDIKYKFTSRYISDYDEAMAQLRQMPELHQLYINGEIKINQLGEIRYYVSYTYLSNLYRPVFIPY